MTVGISANPLVLNEEQGTVLTFTITSSEPIPSGGLAIGIDSDVENALGQFDISNAGFNNARLIGANDDNSGLNLQLEAQTATFTLPIINDENPDGIENLTFAVQPGEGYTVDPNSSSVSLTLQDADSPAPELQATSQATPESNNTVPVAQNDSYTVASGQELNVDVDRGVLANDTGVSEGDILSATVIDAPDSGSYRTHLGSISQLSSLIPIWVS
ncbi:MAG: hypothetical protein MJK14_27225 [Rivularia sp. ALOHA_DT_140]|nr:hypothetical protein [Rivularia sp. ALOHA_DT_140]